MNWGAFSIPVPIRFPLYPQWLLAKSHRFAGWWFGTFFIFPYTVLGISLSQLFGGLEHFLFFHIQYWEIHHPNWRTHIFQRGRYTTSHRFINIHLELSEVMGGTPKNPPSSWGTPIDGPPYVYSNYWVLNPSKSVNVINPHRMVLPSYKLVYRPIYIYIYRFIAPYIYICIYIYIYIYIYMYHTLLLL